METGEWDYTSVALRVHNRDAFLLCPPKRLIVLFRQQISCLCPSVWWNWNNNMFWCLLYGMWLVCSWYVGTNWSSIEPLKLQPGLCRNVEESRASGPALQWDGTGQRSDSSTSWKNSPKALGQRLSPTNADTSLAKKPSEPPCWAVAVTALLLFLGRKVYSIKEKIAGARPSMESKHS